MSDVMFYGVLRMPFEMAMNGVIAQRQFYGRAQEAANRVEKLEKEVEQLREKLALRDAHLLARPAIQFNRPAEQKKKTTIDLSGIDVRYVEGIENGGYYLVSDIDKANYLASGLVQISELGSLPVYRAANVAKEQAVGLLQADNGVQVPIARAEFSPIESSDSIVMDLSHLPVYMIGDDSTEKHAHYLATDVIRAIALSETADKNNITGD